MSEKIIGETASIKQNHTLDKQVGKSSGITRKQIFQLLTAGTVGYFGIVEAVNAKNIDRTMYNSEISSQQTYNFSNAVEVNTEKKISAQMFIEKTSQDLI